MSSYLHSQRSAKNTVLRTNQNSKWVQNFRKDTVFRTRQLSVQYSTMQISFIHIYWTYISFFGNVTESTIGVGRGWRGKHCLLHHLYRLRHGHDLSSPTHADEFMLDGKTTVKSVQWLGIVQNKYQKSNQCHNFQNSLHSPRVFTSYIYIYSFSNEQNCPFRESNEDGGGVHTCTRARKCPCRLFPMSVCIDNL